MKIDNIVQEGLVNGTLRAYENENLEEIIKESLKRRDQVRSLAQSDNKIFRAMIWLFLSIALFLFLPLLLTGCVVKGLNKVTWAQFGFCGFFFLVFFAIQKLLL